MPMGIPPCDVGYFCFRTNNEGGSPLFPAPTARADVVLAGEAQRSASGLRHRSAPMQLSARSAPFEATTSHTA